MGPILEELRSLQVVELKLAVLRRTREAKERRVEACKRRLQKAEERLDQDRRIIRERQARVDSLGLEVASRDESVTKHRAALAKAKTNKEYAAILTAMNTEKADTTKTENLMLEMMEQIQSLKDAQTAAEQERDKLEAAVRTAEAELAAFDTERRQEADELETARSERAKSINPTILSTFTRAAQRHDGEAMAAIRKLHPKREEFVCSGCNMNLRLELVNALQTRDELQLCGACGRILFLEAFEGARRG